MGIAAGLIAPAVVVDPVWDDVGEDPDKAGDVIAGDVELVLAPDGMRAAEEFDVHEVSSPAASIDMIAVRLAAAFMPCVFNCCSFASVR